MLQLIKGHYDDCLNCLRLLSFKHVSMKSSYCYYNITVLCLVYNCRPKT